MIRNSVTRRVVLGALAASAAARPLAALAQAQARPFLIGVLLRQTPEAEADKLNALLEGLSQLGWVEGRNIALEVRYGRLNNPELPALAAELVALAPDVLVGANAAPILALKGATATIPIVLAGGTDAVLAGAVASLARPEGNITGWSGSEAGRGKSVELALALVPGAAKVGYVARLGGAIVEERWQQARDAAVALGVELVRADTNPPDIEVAVRALANEGVGIVLLIDTSGGDFARGAAVLAAAGIPVLGNTDNGAVANYGSAPAVVYWRLAAEYVDKILRGAKPADLPVQLLPTWMSINLKNAQALGLTIPLAVQVRADEVIE